MNNLYKLTSNLQWFCIIYFLFFSTLLVYGQYGINNDFDGDGILNGTDIDDDNDGVLDVTEDGMSALVSPISASASHNFGSYWTLSTTINGTEPAFSGGIDLTDVISEPSNAGDVHHWHGVHTLTTAILTYNFSGSPTLNGIALWNPKQTYANHDDEGIREFYIKVTNNLGTITYGPFIANPTGASQTFNFTSTQNVSKIELDVKNGWYDPTATNNPISTVGKTVSSAYNMVLNEFRALSDLGLNAQTDIDNDGILNRFDLDSDGDGCSDALEAGATKDKSSNYQFSGVVGSNGLIDTKETSPGSGRINYVSTYSTYAAVFSVKICLDTDNDGIVDINDLDDDNDGITDINEDCNVVTSNSDGLLNYKFYISKLDKASNAPQYHYFVPISGNGNAGYNYLPSVDANGLPAVSLTNLNLVSSTLRPFSFLEQLSDSKQELYIYDGWVHFPANEVGLPLKVRSKGSLGTVCVLAWVLSSDLNKANWKDPINTTNGALLLDMNNTETVNNTFYNTSGAPLGCSHFGGASYGVPAHRTSAHLINYQVNTTVSSKGHFFRLYILDPVNGWLQQSFEYSTDNGITWKTITDNMFSSTTLCDGNVDKDGDGVINSLDLDSDNDGCYDAIEGAASITYTQLNNNGSISGSVNANGIPLSAGANGQDKGLSQDNSQTAPDCDNDGDGIVGAADTDPSNPCIPVQSLGYNGYDNQNTIWQSNDCDGDGEVNGVEDLLDDTDPYNYCSFNTVNQLPSLITQSWKDSDCDGDGNRNSSDPNVLTKSASDDKILNVPVLSTGTVNVLANDDYLPNNNANNLPSTSITNTSYGTAKGTVSFDAYTGVMSYTPLASEENTTVVVTYEVCNNNTGSSICTIASVTINVTPPLCNIKSGVISK